MKRINHWLWIISLIATGLHAQQTISFTDGKTIEDYGSLVFTETFSTGEDYNRLILQVDISHSWVNDLELNITNPAGTKQKVFSRLGDNSCFGCDGSDIQLTFSDDTVVSYDSLNRTCGNDPAYQGNAQPMFSLDALLNDDPGGDWTVELIDFWPHEKGIIHSISIEFSNYSAPVCSDIQFPINQSTGVPIHHQMQWNAAPQATGYFLNLGTSPGNYDLIDQLDLGDALSYELTDLICGQQYFVKINPYNEYGVTAGCPETQFETEFVTAEVPESIEICLGDSLQIDGSGGDSYQWMPEMFFDDPTSQNPVFIGGDITEISLTVINENGCRDTAYIAVQLNEVGFTLDSVRDVRLNSPGFIEISMDGPEGSYLFDWTGPDDFQSESEDLDSLEIGCYTLYITEITTGCVLDTIICVDDLTGTEIIGLDKNLRIYPNPAREMLYIERSKSLDKIVSISCLNLKGAVVFSDSLEKGQRYLCISVKQQQPGYYILTIRSITQNEPIIIPWLKY